MLGQGRHNSAQPVAIDGTGDTAQLMSAVRKLKVIEVYPFGDVGIAGGRPQGERLYSEMIARRDAVE